MTATSTLGLLPLLGTAVQWAAFRLARVPVNTVSVFFGSPITTFPLLVTTLACAAPLNPGRRVSR